MRPSSKRSNRPPWNKTSTILSPSTWPPFISTGFAPSAASRSAARGMSGSALTGKPTSTSASGMFGVNRAAIGSSVSRSAASASLSNWRWPPLAIITGSTTSGTPGACFFSEDATVAITSALCSMPVLSASAPMSLSTTSICWAMKAGSIATTPCTPSVFWAVRTVIAVAAKAPMAVTALMSAWIPAPPPESEPATIRTRPFMPPSSRRSSRDRLDDLVDDAAHEVRIVAFGHDADQRLGARLAHQDAAGRAELRLGGGDRLGDGVGGQRRVGIADTDVLQQLRHRVKGAEGLARRLAGLDHGRQRLQGGHQSVAGCGMVDHDDMARLFAAEIVAVGPHALEHVAVAHRRPNELELARTEIALEPEIGHHGGDHTAACQAAVAPPLVSDGRHELVAVDQPSVLARQDHAVGIAVQRNADIGVVRDDVLLQQRRMRRAAIAVDVEAVRRHGERDHLGAELPQHGRRRLVGGAIGAIDDDPEAAQIEAARGR